MKLKSLVAIAGLGLISVSQAQTPFFTEIYLNPPSTDNGKESVEIQGQAGASLAGYSINIPSGAPNGTYSLYVKGGTFLGNYANVTLTGGSVSGVNIALTNGDVDQDGEVGATDFDAVVAQFGNTGSADCDNDGEVGASDYDIVVANFGLGDNLP